ncbi:MAG TPA: aromatic acid exporter family protein [Tissierellaceae bacterium]|nr:aromatic acid exporter family protein [Tissierellaceae bacterium]
MKFAKIGMRTVKTVIAVILTLIVAEVFKLRSPLLASIAAIMTMESSISESFVTGTNRMYGTILGGFTALIVTLIVPGNFIALAIGLIFIINICTKFNWEKAARISMVVFLAIVLNYDMDDGLSYAVNRTLDTLIGVIIGTAINYFVRPPKLDEKIKQTAEKMLRTTQTMLERLIWKQEYDNLDHFSNEIDSMKKDYKTLREDLKFQIGKTTNTAIYADLSEAFEKLQLHMSILHLIKEWPVINKNNKDTIEGYYGKAIPKEKNGNDDELDVIYNYHLESLMKELLSIKELIYKSQDIVESN